jgi:hypothetical protein
MRRNSHWITFALGVPLLLTAACGPVAIGAAVSSGRGGARTVEIETPQVDVIPGAVTSGREITFTWGLIQSQQRRVRLFLSYSAPCHGAGAIPVERLRLTHDVAGGESEVRADADGGYTLAGTAAPGVICKATWAFADQFGVAEARGVNVTLRYQDELLPELADNKQLLSDRKLGSAAPTLANLTLARRNANVGGEESPIDCRLQLADHTVYDGDAPSWEIEYRATATGSWTALNSRAVTLSRRDEGCPVNYTGDVAIDPLADAMPFANYSELGVRVRALEGKLASAWVEAQLATTVGLAPQITRVTIPNPNNNQSSLAEPRFQLPITLEVINRSARQVEVQFRGEYSINAGPRRPLTLARAREAGTAERIVMNGGESRIHYLIWNVVADEGLGIPLDDPAATPQLASVFVRGEIVDDRGPARVLGDYKASDEASQLYTSPFVAYQSVLQDPAERLVSAGIALSPRTRDLFFSRLERRGPLNARAEWVAGVDQTFAPIRIPGLQPYDIYNTLGSQHGIIDIYPTDLLANAPDCLVRLARNENPFYHLTWPLPNQGPVVEPIPLRTGGLRSGSGRVEMNVAFGQSTLPSVVFHGGDDIASDDIATVHLIGIARNEQTSPRWRATTQPFSARLPRKASGASFGPRPTFRVLGGDYDGDPATTEVFVAHEGIERATATAPGWFDVFRVQATAPSGDLAFALQAPRAVPAPLPAPGAVDRDTDYWDLCDWPNPVDPTRPAILLVRTFAARTGLPRVNTFDLLRQGASGGFANSTWERLGELTDNDVAGKVLLHACALDLDGSLGGTAEPELIAMFARRGPALLDVRLRVAAAGRMVWRRTLADMVPAKPDADRYDRGQLVDVNGDDFPDLVVRQSDPGSGTRDSSSGFYAIASALTGVAGGLSEVAVTASNTPSRQPAAGDFNLDGYADVISRGILHLGQPNGTYSQTTGIGPASPTASYIARRVFEVGRRDTSLQDLITFDPSGASSVQRFTTSNRTVVPGQAFPITAGGGAGLRAVLPFVQVGRGGAADHNELAAVVGDGVADNRLHRAAFDGSAFITAPWPNFSLPILRDLAALRTGDLAADEDPANTQHPQSLAVARPGSNQFVLFNALAGHAASSLTVGGAAETIVRLAAASATDDRLEDLLVLTLEGSRLVRLYCLPQQVDGRLGPGVLFLQFDEWDGADFRGIGFNPTGQSLAQGIVVFRTGLRIVLPTLDGGGVQKKHRAHREHRDQQGAERRKGPEESQKRARRERERERHAPLGTHGGERELVVDVLGLGAGLAQQRGQVDGVQRIEQRAPLGKQPGRLGAHRRRPAQRQVEQGVLGANDAARAFGAEQHTGQPHRAVALRRLGVDRGVTAGVLVELEIATSGRPRRAGSATSCTAVEARGSDRRAHMEGDLFPFEHGDLVGERLAEVLHHGDLVQQEVFAVRAHAVVAADTDELGAVDGRAQVCASAVAFAAASASRSEGRRAIMGVTGCGGRARAGRRG